MVDDAAFEENHDLFDDNDDWSIVTPNETLFYVSSTDNTSLDSIPRTAVSVVCHQVRQIVDSTNFQEVVRKSSRVVHNYSRMIC